VRFGNTLRMRERSRDVWGWAWLDALVRDVRFAAGGLRPSPLFTLAATLSLALGLALTTSTVSIVNAYRIRSLPYPESRRIGYGRRLRRVARPAAAATIARKSGTTNGAMRPPRTNRMDNTAV